MAKYDPLKIHLIRHHPRELMMTFDEIEQVLDAKLPTAARRPQFWANPVSWYNAFLVVDADKVRFVPHGG